MTDQPIRRAMTPARKRRIWLRVNGVCWVCGLAVPEVGPDVRYDHRGTLFITESDDDAGIFPIHRKVCDETKTPADQTRIAKTKRQMSMRLDAPPKVVKRKIASRGFAPGHRPMPSRPFPKRMKP